MKTGQDWIESPERRAVELGVLGALGVPVGVTAVAAGAALKLTDPDNEVMYWVERGKNLGDSFWLPKLGDPHSPGRLVTILRKAMIDESPQLLRVLSQEMTLIGPRPDDPRQLAAVYEAGSDQGLKDFWNDVARANQLPGMLSHYANFSHRNNLEGKPEADRFGSDPKVRTEKADLRIKMESDEYLNASPLEDAKVLMGVVGMVAANYSKYTQRGVRRLQRLATSALARGA